MKALRKSAKKAFTLIEILVATVIMVIMIGLVIQITSEVLKVWNRSSDKLSANAQARIAMELITNDIEMAVMRNNGLRWIESTQEIIDNLGANPLTGTSLQTTSLHLFASALDSPETDAVGNVIGGDLCAISYQLVYQDPVDGNDDPEDNVYVLHRRLIDPQTTFELLMGDPIQENFILWNGSGTVASSPLITPAAPNSPVYLPPSDASNFLASNVIEFRVDFYYEDSNEVLQLAPPTMLYGGDNPLATMGPGSDPALDRNHPLAFAEIKLRILEDDAMALLRLPNGILQAGFPDTAEGLRSYIIQNSEIYIRRVYFQTRPL